MRKIKTLFIAILLGIISCNTEDTNYKEIESAIANKFYLPSSEALSIGLKHFEIERKGKADSLKSGRLLPAFRNKKVKEEKTYKKDGEDLFHIINYEGGGFVIISADKRVTPVLAYSENNTFDGEELPGISDWINAISEGILKAKKELKEPRKKEMRLWEIYTGKKDVNQSLIQPPVEDPCNNCDGYWSYSTGQFVDAVAQWSQGGQYSWYSPGDGGCSCDKKPAGCGPVAMAMVMNYYQHPYMNMSFNGESLTTNYPMPQTIPYNCTYPTNQNDRQVSMLIRLCGSFAGSGYGVLGNCSTWTYPGDINNALANMGFSNGGTWDSLSDNYQIVKGELKYFHPVIMTGTSGIFNLNNAHIWVADGYESLAYEYESISYDQFGNPHCICVQYSSEKIGMNWGHGGSANGLYLANYSFTEDNGSTSTTYDTYLRALTGIRP